MGAMVEQLETCHSCSMVELCQMPSRKVLVVDDDDLFRGILAKLLGDLGYEVIQANSGRSAQHLLGIAGVHLIVSDICMPDGDGIELLKFAIEHEASVPVVMMTGFGAIPEVQEAADSGAAYFLPKPFQKSDLHELLVQIFSPKDALFQTGEKEIPRERDEEFEKVGIGEFATGKRIMHDIYVRLKTDRYVKVANRGEDLDLLRVEAYRSKGVTHLYLKREDFIRKHHPKTRRAIRYAHGIELNGSSRFGTCGPDGSAMCFVEGVDREFFAQAADVVHSTIAVIAETPSMESLFRSLAGPRITSTPTV